ncbi:MAG: hydroxyacid dehydrogenase [Chloroflexota bacterium]
MPGVLVLAPMHRHAIELLRSHKLRLTEAFRATYEDACRLAPDQDAIVTRVSVRVDEALLDRAKRLKVLAIASVGMDHVDLAAVRRRGITCFNGAAGNAQAVAELALGNAIALLRQTFRASADIHQGTWERERYPGHELAGRTLGIVGLGATGSRVARLALAFGVRLIAHDPYVRYVYDAGLQPAERVAMVTLDELLAEADIVSVHVPLTSETRHMFSTEQFQRMKRTAYFINLARGPVVDEQALAEALRQGVISGAAIDVFEEEPPVHSPLLGLANCLLTPHIGGIAEEAMERIGLQVAQRLIDELRRLGLL